MKTLMRLCASTACALIMSAAGFAQHYTKPTLFPTRQEVPDRVDQTRNFLPAQYRWQPTPILRVGQKNLGNDGT